MAVTLQDIADRLNLNKASVSRVLRGSARASEFKPETRDKIIATAREMGYRRDEYAAAISTGRSNASGFLYPCYHNEFCSRLLGSMLFEANKHNHMIKLIPESIDWKPTSPEEIVDACLRQRLFALTAFNNLCEPEKLCPLLKKHGILLSLAGSMREYPGINSFSLDNYDVGRQAFLHLHSLGHRKFLVAGFGQEADWSYYRLTGFRDAAREAGVEIPQSNFLIVSKDHLGADSQFSPENLRTLFKGKDAPTGAFAFNDLLAINLMLRLGVIGIKIPEDLSLVGCGNSIIASSAFPALTSFDDSTEEIGREIFNFILNRRDSPVSELPEKKLFRMKLVVRESTAFISASTNKSQGVSNDVCKR